MISRSSPVSDVRLSLGDSADLDGVMTVMSAAFVPEFGEAWTRSQCAGILPMSGVSLMLARGAEEPVPLGFSLYRTVGDEAELLLLAVAPDHRRQGIGRRLLDEFIARARSDGVWKVHLEVRDGNPAVRMYSAAGFEVAGRRRDYYRGCDGGRFDALTLARNL